MNKVFGATTELDASFPEDNFNSVFIMMEDSITHDLQNQNLKTAGKFRHEKNKVWRFCEITGQPKEVWVVTSRVDICPL